MTRRRTSERSPRAVGLKVSAHGVPTAGGIALFVLGGLLLYHGSTSRVSRPLLITLSVAFAALFLILVRAGMRRGAQGFALALTTVFESARGVDAKTMGIQYLEALKALGASPSTKFVLPLEFSNLLQGLVGVTGSAVSDRADGVSEPPPPPAVEPPREERAS